MKTRVWVVCVCGSGRWLSKGDAARTRMCKKCHNKQIARKGYEAVQKKYGVKSAVKHVREHLLLNPSNLERMLAAALDGLGASYEREYWLQPNPADRVYLIDFAVRVGGELRFIEVNGNYVHAYHTERDANKVKAIANIGRPLLVLSDEDIDSDDLPAVLEVFLS